MYIVKHEICALWLLLSIFFFSPVWVKIKYFRSRNDFLLCWVNGKSLRMRKIRNQSKNVYHLLHVMRLDFPYRLWLINIYVLWTRDMSLPYKTKCRSSIENLSRIDGIFLFDLLGGKIGSVFVPSWALLFGLVVALFFVTSLTVLT